MHWRPRRSVPSSHVAVCQGQSDISSPHRHRGADLTKIWNKRRCTACTLLWSAGRGWFARCGGSTKTACVIGCVREKWARTPDWNEDVAPVPVSYRREYGTAAWQRVTRSQLRDCKQECTVRQEVRAVAFDARVLSGHSGRRVEAGQRCVWTDSRHHTHTPVLVVNHFFVSSPPNILCFLSETPVSTYSLREKNTKGTYASFCPCDR